MTSTFPEVSFVLPCLNEAESVGAVIKEINSSYSDSGLSYEIIVADNGSDDGSQEIVRNLGGLVVNVKRRGYGAALIGGISAARGKFVIMGDADGSYTFGNAVTIIEGLRSGADLVMGNRFKGGIAPGAMPWLHRYLGNPVLSWLGRLFFNIPIGDFHCGLRGFNRKKVVELKLNTPGMEFASEMLVRAQKAKFKISEVPVTLKPDLRSRAPHLKTWRDGWRHLRFLLLHSPSWAFAIPAALIAIMAIVLGFSQVDGQLTIGHISLSYRSALIASSVSLVSIIALWSSHIARLALGEVEGRTLPTELLGIISGVIALLGAAIVTSTFATWAQLGFAALPDNESLTKAIVGCFLLSTGGVSFFMALLSGLIRATR